MTPAELRHLLPYDPQEAHNYYEQHKQLKGRQPAAAKPAPKVRPLAKRPVAKPIAKKAVAPKKSAAQVKAEADAAVKKLQDKLTKLKDVLAELVKQAKERGGIATTTSAKKPAAAKAPTSTQKSAAAKAAHDYYEKHKASMPDATPAEQEKALNTQIKQIETKIKAVKAQLAAAAQKLQPKPVHIVAAPKPSLSKKEGLLSK